MTPQTDYGLPLVMTAEQVAELLGLNVKSVYAAALLGEIPARRIGKRVVFWRDALLSWLSSNERVPGSRK
jgi:excisionase family DNA binding protein